MDTSELIDAIFNYYEIRNDILNGDLYPILVDEIYESIGIKVGYGINSFNPEYAINLAKIALMFNEFAFFPNTSGKFYEILKSHNYFMKTTIKDAMGALGRLNNPNNNSRIIRDFLVTPVIDDITFDGKDTFKIISNEFGEFSFSLATKVLSKNEDVIKYIDDSIILNGKCHEHAAFFLNNYDDLYLICSKCPNYFLGTYYHSYTYDKEHDDIIDLCSNAVIKKQEFDRLYEPMEIVNMQNKEARDYYNKNVRAIPYGTTKSDIVRLCLYIESLSLSEEEKEKIRNYKK